MVQMVQMVQPPSEYPWSSYRSNALGKPMQLLTPHSVYRQLGQIDTEQQRAYRALFRGLVSEQDLATIR